MIGIFIWTMIFLFTGIFIGYAIGSYLEMQKQEETRVKELEVETVANRALLHINKLKDFEKWLEKQGYMILPTSKNPYEVLRAKKDKDTVIIYQKGDSKEHLSIMDKDYPLIHKFITENKSKTNADRIRNMSDEELACLIEKIKMCGGLIETERSSYECKGCKDGYCDDNVRQWLQSEAE